MTWHLEVPECQAEESTEPCFFNTNAAPMPAQMLARCPCLPVLGTAHHPRQKTLVPPSIPVPTLQAAGAHGTLLHTQ